MQGMRKRGAVIDTAEYPCRTDLPTCPSHAYSHVRATFRMTYMNQHKEIEEFALSKEQILAARSADTGPVAHRPQPENIECASRGALDICILGSGSKGNCTIISGPKGAVMVDCGFSARYACNRMKEAGIDPASIDAILLTHEHTDHFAGIDVLSRKLNVPIYTAEGTSRVPKVSKLRNVEAIHNRTRMSVAGIDITTFPTSHDAADPIGFRFEAGGDVFGYATDTGVMSQEGMELLGGCRILALESNHDEKMLAQGPYPGYLKTRISGTDGHLSNAQAREVLTSLLDDNLQCVVGMHLSQINNLPDLAMASLRSVMSENDHPARIAVASQGRILSVR